MVAVAPLHSVNPCMCTSLTQSSVWYPPSVPGAVGEFPNVTILAPNVGPGLNQGHIRQMCPLPFQH